MRIGLPGKTRWKVMVCFFAVKEDRHEGFGSSCRLSLSVTLRKVKDFFGGERKGVEEEKFGTRNLLEPIW